MMIRLVNKSSFFIRMKGGYFEKVNGVSLQIENIDLFVHKYKKVFFVVSESSSGMRVSKIHKTPKSAIKYARKVIEEKGEGKVNSKIEESIGNYFLSPKYKFIVNPTRNVAPVRN